MNAVDICFANTEAKPTQIVWGTRAAIQAEYGTLPVYHGKYLVQPTGDGEWDAEGFATKAEAKAEAKALAAVLNVPPLWVA